MQMRFFQRAAVFVLCAGLFFASKAHALLEVRAHGMAQAIHPNDLNQRHRDFNVAQPKSLFGYGLDALLLLTGVPIGFGVRYETAQIQDSTSSGTQGEYRFETGFSRIAVLVNKRLVDSEWYLGPIFGIGITNSVWYDFTSGGQSDSFRTVGGTSISTAVESGIKLKRLILGAEAGYMFAEFRTPKNASRSELTSTAGKVGLDFSGPYFKFILGYELL